MKGPIWPTLSCLLAAALFGASTPVSKVLLDDMGPLILAGLLYLGAGLATLPFAIDGGSPQRRWDRANLWRLLGALCFGGALGPVLLLYGLQLAPSASVSLWLNLETVATAVLAWIFFGENLGPRLWAASAGTVLAGILLATPDGMALAPAAILIALASLCWGLDNNLTALIDGYTPEQTTVLKGLFAGLVNLGLGLGLGQDLPDTTGSIRALSVGALAYGASIVLYIRGAQQLGATRAQMLFSTAPFLGVGMAWVGLSEPIEPVQLLAAALLVGALALMWTTRHDHTHRHHETVHTHLHNHVDGHHDHTHDDLPPDAWHTHEHRHDAVVHTHPHQPDLHHRHHGPASG